MALKRFELVLLQILSSNRADWWLALDLVRAARGYVGPLSVYRRFARLEKASFITSRDMTEEEATNEYCELPRRRLYQIAILGIRQARSLGLVQGRSG